MGVWLLACCATVLGRTCCRQVPGHLLLLKHVRRGQAIGAHRPRPVLLGPCREACRPATGDPTHPGRAGSEPKALPGTRDTISYCGGEVQSADCNVPAVTWLLVKRLQLHSSGWGPALLEAPRRGWCAGSSNELDGVTLSCLVSQATWGLLKQGQLLCLRPTCAPEPCQQPALQLRVRKAPVSLCRCEGLALCQVPAEGGVRCPGWGLGGEGCP